MMRYQYDLLVIGLGPAGMAAAIMGHEMGLKVCAIERANIGGECMNVGCIPSKALLRIAKAKHMMHHADELALELTSVPQLKQPFAKIAQHLQYIRDKKTTKMFAEITVETATAKFLDRHTVQVGTKQITAKRIFIATGTKPFVPPIPGIAQVPFLTNETIFKLTEVPKSLIILGGGPIGVEMAQAFARLGTKCYIIHAAEHIIPQGDPAATQLVAEALQQEGVEIYNQQKILAIHNDAGQIRITFGKEQTILAEKLLVAAGRQAALTDLQLDAVGITLDQRGFIKVNNYLQTNCKNIYAVGDCNGQKLFSHAAMQQSMLALINALAVTPLKMNFKKQLVPWTIFTEPQYSAAGMSEAELVAKKIKFETIQVNYHDYGAAIAEAIAVGFVKVFVSKYGRIYGAVIVGEGSGEMIHEWVFAIQHKINIAKILFLQHSFPTMSFLNKRVAETWMLQRMRSNWLKQLCRLLFFW